MLIIRLARVGKRNEPHFRIVLTDHRRAVRKGAMEILGFYHPTYAQDKQLVIKADRIKYWVSKGASLSDTMEDIVVREKILDRPKRKFFPSKKKKTEKEVAAKTLETTSPSK